LGIPRLTNKQSVVNYEHIPFVYVRLSRYRGNIDEWDIFLRVFIAPIKNRVLLKTRFLITRLLDGAMF